VNVGFERPGGIELCETVEELEAGQRLLESIRRHEPSLTYEVLDRRALKARVPAASICHSGVTLAAAHPDILAPWIAGGAQPLILHSFVASRSPNSTGTHDV